jgi:hypothetical protein
MTDNLKAQFKTGTPEGKAMLMSIVEKMKKAGRGREFDCVVGISGGTDSSYMLDWAVSNELRVLAVNYNNGWGIKIANDNIIKLLAKLKIDFVNYEIDKAEVNDIFRSFFLAGVIDLDSSSDIALAEALYREADRVRTKYILEGHSFTTEGVSPLSTLYMDGKYIKSVHKMYGSVPLKTFPNMSLAAFLKWTALKRIRKIRPYWYLGHSKEMARDYLIKKYDWQYYNGPHLENKMTEFHHSYYVYNKFGFDGRANGLSALVREGIMNRDEALKVLAEPPKISSELLDYVREQLDLTQAKFYTVMHRPGKTFMDYPNYKKTFQKLRPLFFVLAKTNLVPMSFYLKYCKGV